MGKKLLLFIMLIMAISVLTSCNDYISLFSTPTVVAPTCTEEGYTYYIDYYGNTVLDESGNVKKTDIVPATGRHTPGPEATTTTPQTCTVCGTILRDIRDMAGKTISDNNSGLEINAYLNAKDENDVSYCNNLDHFIVTTVDTQYHNKYQKTFSYRNANGNSQNLKLSITTQEFFNHDVLSLNEVGTSDGKSLTTDSAFQVRYTFTCDQFPLSEKKGFAEMECWQYDSSKAVLNAKDLHFIKYFQPNDGYNGEGYNGVYLLIDVTSAEIQVSRKNNNEYELLSTLNLSDILLDDDASLNDLNGKILLTDSGKSLFYKKGTYRIVFKYGLVWFANTTAVKDVNGKDCYPWGYINDQYDSFYVTIDEDTNVLLPDRTKSDEVENNYFYQISALNARSNQEDNSIIINCAEVKKTELVFQSAGSDIEFCIKNELQGSSDKLLYQGKVLKNFSMAVYVQNNDLGFDEYADLDLIEEFSSELSKGNDIIVAVRKDTFLRTKSCKLSIFYTFEGQEENRQDYYFSIDW